MAILAIAAWLRQGERAAKNLECKQFDRGKFKAELKDLRSLTNETDRFARDFLISPNDAAALPFLAHTTASVTAFARKTGVAPGIIVGRMQHDGLLPMNYLNKLKVRYRWHTE